MPETATTYRRFTKEEYFGLLERSQHRFEFFDGLIFSMHHDEPLFDISDDYLEGLMAKIYHPYNHPLIISNIVAELVSALDRKQYRVYSEGRSVVLAADSKYVYPDIVVAEKGNEQLDEEGLLTNPKIVMEVLSKSTQQRDLRYKMDGYEAVPKLSEYLLVEQSAVGVTHLWKEGDEDEWATGDYHTKLEKTVSLVTLECELPLSAIYEDVRFG